MAKQNLRTRIQRLPIKFSVLMLLLVSVAYGHLNYLIQEKREQIFFERLEKSQAQGMKVIPVASLTQFPWDYVCYLSVYEAGDKLKELSNSSWIPLLIQPQQKLYFVKNGEIVTDFTWWRGTRGALYYTKECEKYDEAKLKYVQQKRDRKEPWLYNFVWILNLLLLIGVTIYLRFSEDIIILILFLMPFMIYPTIIAMRKLTNWFKQQA